MPNDDMSQSFHSANTNDGSHWLPPGSIAHPYRSLMENTIFARCHLATAPPKSPETYTRSLFMLGHGLPLWDPLGSLSSRRKRKHLKTGFSIGDVGFLGPQDGDFEYYFNIFSSPTDDIQVDCPANLEPLPPPTPENISKNDTYFAPGTALASKGVTVTHHATSPLDVEFAINARESGILLLPEGASREDLVSTDVVREYVHKHALAWYVFINKYPGPLCPNGNLFIITGCDKTATYALAFSSSTSLNCSDHAPTIRYQNGEWDGGHRYHIETIESDPSVHSEKCAVIIRGMQVALSPPDWVNYVFRNEPPPRLSFYYMLSVPVTGHRSRWQTMKERYLKHAEKDPDGRARSVVFNPSIVLLHFLIRKSPKGHIAIVEDALWCSLADKSDASLLQILRLLKQVLEEHEIFEENGLVTFVPARRNLEEASPSQPRNLILRVFNPLRKQYQDRNRRWSIARKLSKIFPAQGLPRDMLS